VATTIARLEAVLSAKTSDFDRAMGKSEGRMKGFGKMAALTAGGAGVGLLAAGLKSSVAAAMDAEKSQARMTSQLKSLGISFSKHSSTIENTIQAHSRLSAFDDEDLQDSFTGLVRATGNVNKALSLTGLAADVARGKNIGLESATALVTKASMGQVGALRRVGIDIDKNASKTQIIAALQKKFGGQAEAYGKTAAGSQERFRVALENVQEEVGKHLLPLLTRLMNWVVRDMIPSFQNFGQKTSAVWQAVSGGFRTMGEKLGTIWNAVKNAFLTGAGLIVGGLQKILSFWAGLVSALDTKLTRKLIPGFGALADGVYGAQSRVSGLREQIERLKSKKIKVTAQIVYDLPRGFRSDAFNRGGDISAADVYGNVPEPKLTLGSVGAASVNRRLWDEIAIGNAMGLHLSSGFRPGARVRGSGTPSDHSVYPSKAIDMAGPIAAMNRFALMMAGRSGIQTVINSNLGRNSSIWRAGRGWYGAAGTTYADHFDHVHVDLFDKGGWLPPKSGPRLIENKTPFWEPIGPPLATGSRARGGDVHVHIHGPVYGADADQLGRELKNYLSRDGRRNGR
jgi:hypothetical protein